MSRTPGPAPTGYVVGATPLIAGGDAVYLGRQLQAISDSILSLVRLTPQPATTPPRTLTDGMQRLARAPWWPVVGQTADRWVYFDGPTGTWLYL